MKVKNLLEDIEQFHRELKVHRDIWGKSLDVTIPGFPQSNFDEINIQIENLNESLGRLRPYLLKFRENWTTYGGINVLDAGIGNHHAIHKGPSLTQSINLVGQIIGNLRGLDPGSEVIVEIEGLEHQGKNIENCMGEYIKQMHPKIIESCEGLFEDGHYENAIEASVKGVFEYLRIKAGLKIDGAALVETIFSSKNPILSFGNLAESTILNRQIGFMDLLKGYYKGIRNPISHSEGNEFERKEAFEYLVMAAVLCRTIDKANRIK
jgi:uncharacterized protein (TIGR02391 family)